MHVSVDGNITTQLVSDAIKKFGSLGLKVHITELDVSCPNCQQGNTSELNKQADVYRNVVQACLDNHGVCEAILTWGYTDRFTWLGSDKYPLPFDYNFDKKPAYFAMKDLLNSTPVRTKKIGEEFL
jgi:endo-1,4-beta-xylanase